MSERHGSRTDQTFAKVARRLERRKKGNGKLPTTAEPVAAPQQWLGVAKAASALVDSLSGVPVAAPAVELLTAIAGVEDTQTAMLALIGRDVRLIREGPFHAAQEHLATALRYGRRYGPQHPDYTGELQDAKKSLVQALGRTAPEEDQEKSLIRYQLGLVALLQCNNTTEAEYQLRESYKQEAEHQLRESYKHCQRVVGTFARARNKNTFKENLAVVAHNHPGVGRAGFWGTSVAVAATGGLLFAPLAAGALVMNASHKLTSARRNYRLGTMLESYTPFLNAVVRTLNTVVGNGTQPVLDFGFSGDITIGYWLEWRADETGVW
jgi:hypothetical protein